MISIVHISDVVKQAEEFLYIGRANKGLKLAQSPLHNPYLTKKYGRELSCSMYCRDSQPLAGIFLFVNAGILKQLFTDAEYCRCQIRHQSGRRMKNFSPK